MLTGGASLLAVGIVIGEPGAFAFEEFSTASLLALGYLITFGSVLAYTAYTWSLQHAPVSRVSTYAYVNPIVAIVLGAVVLNESISPTMLVGAAMIVVSVALVVRTESRTTQPTGALEASPAASDEVLGMDETDAERVSRPG
jgi:drug/metabolite transporter (DMT)-like permease